MSDYSLQVVWSGKDAAGGIISGNDFHDEFTEVQGAVNSKADIASPDLTGVPTAPTATHTVSTTTNNTQLATTAFVHLVKESLYPLGSIYTTTDSTVPSDSTRLGFGTWEAFGAGRVLIGAGESTDDAQPTPESQTFTAGTEGGEFNHTLTEAEMPSHNHTLKIGQESGNNSDTLSNSGWSTGIYSNDVDGTNSITDTGSDAAHNNLQPYVVVYMWKRTA